MGFDHLVGSLEPGKQADIACIDLSALETQPLHNVVSQLIYATGRHQVSDVWVAGEHKLRQRVLVDMDLDGVLANARQWRARVAEVRNA
jgi:5-methylthioadenosine/S-adenosylhomocysteine deaminase